MNGVMQVALIAAVVTACGQDTSDQSASRTEAATAASFTGSLTASATTVAVGTPFTVTETATNLTAAQVGPIIVGIRRLGFNVVAAQKPRTGICRVAGSATCNFLELAPGETQSYTLTLVPTAAGTFQIQGWTTSSYVAGGFSGSVIITVH
ncbi:MAG TPA: BatD family protein [Anaeromyxobacteraceae bacterium]|nr:BatD family protein [Anaeromyxobacteraceae bacterium]